MVEERLAGATAWLSLYASRVPKDASAFLLFPQNFSGAHGPERVQGPPAKIPMPMTDRPELVCTSTINIHNNHVHDGNA